MSGCCIQSSSIKLKFASPSETHNPSLAYWNINVYIRSYRAQSASRRHSYHERLQPSEHVTQLRADHHNGNQRSEYVPSPLRIKLNRQVKRWWRENDYFIIIIEYRSVFTVVGWICGDQIPPQVQYSSYKYTII